MAKFLLSPEINHPDLTGVDIAVWHGLSSFAQWEFDEDGVPVRSKLDTCFPSINAIVKRTRFSMATVCRAIQNLEILGYVRRMKGSGRHTTKYVLIPNILTVREHNSKLSQSENVLSHSERAALSERETNIPYNKTNNINNNKNKKEKEKEKNEVKNNKKISKFDTERRPASKKPRPDAFYDLRAFNVINEMYDLCHDYTPDAPSEIRLLQDLYDEYPNINLFIEFRKARDWLENCDENRRPVNLPKFLRRWASNANTKNIIQMNTKKF